MVAVFDESFERSSSRRVAQVRLDGALRRTGRAGHDRRAFRRVEALAHRDRRATACEEMSRGDVLVERGADRLQRLADKAAARGGIPGKLAGELAEDAAFLRRLKPSLIAARARGEAPTNLQPGANVVAPSAPQLGKRPRRRRGPNPFLVIGVAVVAGIALARVIDWRSHAHPRD